MKLDKTLSPTKTDNCRSLSKHAAAAPKPSAHYGDNARVTVCATQGGRKYMEDRLHVHVEHGNVDGVKHAFYAVYDGHGGSQAAEFSRNHLYQNLRTHKHFNSTKDDDVRNAIHDAFLQTHKDMLEVVDSWPRTASGFRSTAGTTASVALIRRGKMYTGHVGDSAIVAGTTGKCSDAHCIVGTMLTTEHKPDAEEEQRRIVDHGGSIACKSGVMRVVWNRTRKGYTPSLGRRGPRPTESIPFLAVARSLGDLWSYNAESDEYIVSPKPDTDVVVLDASFKCIVLASDGLWNVMRAQNCVDIVNSREWRRFPPSTGVMSSCAEERLPHDRHVHENHARALIRHGLRLWSHMRSDNISVAVVVFDPPETSIGATQPCVHMDDFDVTQIDRVLTDQPDMMLRISDAQTQLIRTAPVELVYNGAIDNPAGGPPIRVTPNVIAQIRSSFGNVFAGIGFCLFSTSPMGNTLENTQMARHNELNPVKLVQYTTRSRSRNSTSTSSCSLSAKDESPVSMVKWSSISTAISSLTNGGSPCSVTKTVASYYCNKHGLSCDKVKLANDVASLPSPASIAGRASKRHSIAAGDVSPVGTKAKRPTPMGTPQSHATEDVRRGTGENKYYCRKHGLQCDKVRQMNLHWSLDMSVANDDVGSDEEVGDVNTPLTRLRSQSSTAASGSASRVTPLGKRTHQQATRAPFGTPVTTMTTTMGGDNAGTPSSSHRLRANTVADTARSTGSSRGTRNKVIQRPAQKQSMARQIKASLLSARTTAAAYARPALHRPGSAGESSSASTVTSPMTHTANMIVGMKLTSARKTHHATFGRRFVGNGDAPALIGRSMSADDSPPDKNDDTVKMARRESISGSPTSATEPTSKRPRLFTWMTELFGKKEEK